MTKRLYVSGGGNLNPSTKLNSNNVNLVIKNN